MTPKQAFEAGIGRKRYRKHELFVRKGTGEIMKATYWDIHTGPSRHSKRDVIVIVRPGSSALDRCLRDQVTHMGGAVTGCLPAIVQCRLAQTYKATFKKVATARSFMSIVTGRVTKLKAEHV
jgi:hypothetical protein